MIRINKLVTNSIVITTGPVVKAETHIKFVDGTEGDYLIEGAMDCPALIAAGCAMIGFQEIVAKAYPVLGYLSLLILLIQKFQQTKKINF